MCDATCATYRRARSISVSELASGSVARTSAASVAAGRHRGASILCQNRAPRNRAEHPQYSSCILVSQHRQDHYRSLRDTSFEKVQHARSHSSWVVSHVGLDVDGLETIGAHTLK